MMIRQSMGGVLRGEEDELEGSGTSAFIAAGGARARAIAQKSVGQEKERVSRPDKATGGYREEEGT